jgi:NADPH2:quinone reductase
MRAVVLDAPGPPDALQIRELPIPATLGAVPEMLLAANGSLTVGLDVQAGQTLLIRGGTSSVGMATAVLAKDRGLTVLSTTRRPDRLEVLRKIGVDHPIVDDGEIAEKVREIVPDGVDAALELVGSNTLRDTLRATRVHGVTCFTGMLGKPVDDPRLLPDRLHSQRSPADCLRRPGVRPPSRCAAVLP